MLSHVFRCDDCFLDHWNWPIRLSNTRDEVPLHYLSPLLASVVSTLRHRRFPTELLFGYLAVIYLLCFTVPGNDSAALHYTYTEHQDGHYTILTLNIKISTTLYLHWTSRLALALTVTLNPFSAEHQYSPDWFLFASKLRVSPSVRVLPSFDQVIVGDGFPEALQWNVALVPSITVWSSGVVIKLGST